MYTQHAEVQVPIISKPYKSLPHHLLLNLIRSSLTSNFTEVHTIMEVQVTINTHDDAIIYCRGLGSSSALDIIPTWQKFVVVLTNNSAILELYIYSIV